MKAQVTAFAIIGILVVLAIGGLMWLAHLPAVKQSRAGTSTLDLENCIETKAASDIQQVGLDGGVGPSANPVLSGTVQGQSGSVRYGILARSPGDPIGPTENLGFTIGVGRSTGFLVFPRFDSNLVGPSTSSTITSLIESDAQSCSSGLTITGVTFSENDVTITGVERSVGRSPQDVTVKLSVPIKRYSEAMFALLSKEAADPTFRVSTASPGSDYSTQLVGTPGGNEMLILTSDRPELNGQPFVYRSIIANRPPVFVLPASGPHDTVAGTLSCDLTTQTVNALPADVTLVDPDDLDQLGTPPITTTTCTGGSGGTTYIIHSSGRTDPVTV